MPISLKKPLPPKPVTPIKKSYQSAGAVRAVSITVELEDGTTLQGTGLEAAMFYDRMMECERYCASNPGTVSTYLGPQIRRYDADGKEIPLAGS